MVRAIDGGPALPVDKPPRPFESGIEGRPTLVANVETLANVPCIALRGPDVYRRVGTTSSPGTFLLTVSGACARPGLYEVPLGIPLRTALDTLAGVTEEPLGVLMGGFFGGVLGARALDVRLAYDELRDEGSGLGCGAVIVLGADDCPVAAVADLLSYFERENAKQCGACIRGTAAMRDAVLALAAGPRTQITSTDCGNGRCRFGSAGRVLCSTARRVSRGLCCVSFPSWWSAIWSPRANAAWRCFQRASRLKPGSC